MDATEKLFFACQNGNTDDVKTHMKEVCVNIQDAEGVTPLQVAAANGHEEVVYLLLSSKAEIDLANSSGWTPLMLSARYGHTAVVSLLINNGARVNVCNKLGVQPLTAAARSGHLPTVRLLLEAGADPVIRHSAPLDGSSYMYGSGDLTPLMTAALQGHDPIVKLLIEWKVDVNQAIPVTGLTPLMMAAWSGHKQTSQILLECGADPNMTNLGDKTALDIATLRGKREVKAYLDDKTVARTTEYVEKSEADIIEAVKKGNSKWLEQLLKEEPDLSNWCQDDDGATPLMYAAMLGHLDIVKLLINHGADLNKQETKRGWTALMQAVVYEYVIFLYNYTFL
ncbi:ankyrin repeat and SAM domain-containing protein 6-like [Limulus polyphemus]|uniref:Ankyrin repeat and SAM domain-containing protein 6-like n=1 Tax=Limulus polyphemus TaxID=6850 RepID=A0ABM1T4F9_LIMPO|nr:ankyrin repeat and SAM domain-containing protein 6-like [Limulus polyphemus]